MSYDYSYMMVQNSVIIEVITNAQNSLRVLGCSYRNVERYALFCTCHRMYGVVLVHEWSCPSDVHLAVFSQYESCSCKNPKSPYGCQHKKPVAVSTKLMTTLNIDRPLVCLPCFFTVYLKL